MKVSIEPIREEFSREIYWTRVHLTSSDGSRDVTILASVSLEYLWDKNKTKKIEKEHLDNWKDELEKRWSQEPESKLKKDIYFETYATSAEGRANGLDFLMNEVKP